MRRKLFVMAAAISGIAAPFMMNTAPSHAMTCATDPPIDYACDVVFYVVGTACNGQAPKPGGPPLPPIVRLNTATSINLCPPLG